MTPALVFTIVTFIFAMGIQAAIFAYYYGRLTMKVDMIETSVGSKASKEHLGTVESTVDKLAGVVQKLIDGLDEKFSAARSADNRDDQQMLAAVAHLEEYIELAVAWIGERFGTIGTTLNDHDRLIRKALKANGLSDDRIQSQQGGTTDTGKHRVIPPPLRPMHSTGTRMPPIPGRKSDPRTE